MLKMTLYFYFLFLQIQSKNKRQYFTHSHNVKTLQHNKSNSLSNLQCKLSNDNAQQCGFMPNIKICSSYTNKSLTNNHDPFRSYIPNLKCPDEQVDHKLYEKCLPVYRPTYYPKCQSDYRPFFPRKCPPCSQKNVCSTSQEVSAELNALLTKQSVLLKSALTLIKVETNTTIITELEAYESSVAKTIADKLEVERKFQNGTVTIGMRRIDSTEAFFVRTALLNLISNKLGPIKTDITNIINTVAALADPDIVLTVNDIDSETGLLPQIISEMDELLESIKGEMSNDLNNVLLPGVLNAIFQGFEIIYVDIGKSFNTIRNSMPNIIINSVPALITSMTASVTDVFTNRTPNIQDVLRNYADDLKAVASAAISCYVDATGPKAQISGIKIENNLVSLTKKYSNLEQENGSDSMAEKEICTIIKDE